MSARLRISWIVASGIRLNSILSMAGRSSAHRSPHLLERSLARRRLLLLLPDARLVVILSTPKLRQDACLLAGLLETLERALEGLALLDLDHRHVRSPRRRGDPIDTFERDDRPASARPAPGSPL